MAEFGSLDEFETQLDRIIDMAMVMTVQEHAKEAIQDSEENNVYSYMPKFYSRRRESGGIKDKYNMQGTYDPTDKELTIEVKAPLQNLRGNSKNYAVGLVEYIETSQIYHAPPRPFLQQAEDTYSKDQFEKDLMEVLNANGF